MKEATGSISHKRRGGENPRVYGITVRLSRIIQPFEEYISIGPVGLQANIMAINQFGEGSLMVTKETLQEVLQPILWAEESVDAVWEGGSSATGYLDPLSDLDLLILCDDDAVDLLFEKVESILEKHFGVNRKYRVPEPAWHGFSQCFYQLQNTHDLFYLDLCYVRKSNPQRFTESDRHGMPLVWFDRTGILDFSPTPKEKSDQMGKRMFLSAIGSAFVVILEINKAIARDRFAEAFLFYYQLISRNYAILLNLKYRPRQADFGLRYAYRAYPQKTVQFLEQILQVNSLEEIGSNTKKLEARINDLEKELKVDYS